MTAIASPPVEPAAIEHYENFPVASWLCPPRLRAPVAAIYHFARTADDIADEGNADAGERLAMLACYRRDLYAAAGGQPLSDRWPGVFRPLAAQLRAFDLPVPLLDDLLSAFMPDVGKSRDGAGYADWPDLLDYCRRSANPVGRLLLHLYGVRGEQALGESDAICTALQLINFWQDLSVDIPRRRYYLPLADCAAHGLPVTADLATDFARLPDDPRAAKLIAHLVSHTRSIMQQGAPLVRRVPGRAGWELRLMVHGGLRVLDKIAALGQAVLRQRPALGRLDAPLLLWRALLMPLLPQSQSGQS
jgi:squalene synthase HpnC